MVLIQILIKLQLLFVLLALQYVGNQNAMALQVKMNDEIVQVDKLPQIEHLMGSGFGGGLQYIENSRTWDTSRFPRTKPQTLRFTDRFNVRWEVTIHDPWDRVTFVVPCGTEMLWYGDERDRTGSDAQTNFASLSFSYVDGGCCMSPGIRIQFNAYKWKDMEEALIDTERWNNIMNNVVQGVGIATNIAQTAATAFAG